MPKHNTRVTARLTNTAKTHLDSMCVLHDCGPSRAFSRIVLDLRGARRLDKINSSVPMNDERYVYVVCLMMDDQCVLAVGDCEDRTHASRSAAINAIIETHHATFMSDQSVAPAATVDDIKKRISAAGTTITLSLQPELLTYLTTRARAATESVTRMCSRVILQYARRNGFRGRQTRRVREIKQPTRAEIRREEAYAQYGNKRHALGLCLPTDVINYLSLVAKNRGVLRDVVSISIFSELKEAGKLHIEPVPYEQGGGEWAPIKLQFLLADSRRMADLAMRIPDTPVDVPATYTRGHAFSQFVRAHMGHMKEESLRVGDQQVGSDNGDGVQTNSQDPIHGIIDIYARGIPALAESFRETILYVPKYCQHPETFVRGDEVIPLGEQGYTDFVCAPPSKSFGAIHESLRRRYTLFNPTGRTILAMIFSAWHRDIARCAYHEAKKAAEVRDFQVASAAIHAATEHERLSDLAHDWARTQRRPDDGANIHDESACPRCDNIIPVKPMVAAGKQ